MSARSRQFHCFNSRQAEAILQVCRVTERWQAHALFRRHPSNLAVFLGGAHFRRGRGAEDVVGRPDGRTLASLSGPQGATPPPLSHSLTGGRLLLQIASATAIRAQPAERVALW